MPVPVSQALTVASHVIRQKIKGNKYFPLVLMLEPLFRCNLTCAGCGKIQYPKEILDRRLSVEECMKAVDECGAPIVSIPGGEPLIHPEIKEIVEGLKTRKKYIYLCTNALLLKRKLDLFTPSKYLTFNVHLDGLKEEHDQSVGREGIFEIAVEAIKEALGRGFRVTTNTTFFNSTDPEKARIFFDFLSDLGVESMTISPGYCYEKAPHQDRFLKRQQTKSLFAKILENPNKKWRFNQSPLFLEFLKGNIDYDCTPWGNPTYNIFGWQRPCYLIGEGHAKTFQELIQDTDWDNYGTGRNEKCADCMVHCGYEASAVNDTFSSLGGLSRTIRAMIRPRPSRQT